MRRFVAVSTVFLCAGLAYGQDAVRYANASAAELASEPGWLQMAAEPAAVWTASLPNLLLVPPAAFDGGQRYVLQLDGPLDPQRATDLAAAGIELGNYLPNYAYVVDLANVPPAAFEQLDFVNWLGSYQDNWKLATGIGDRMYHTEARQALADAGRVVVDITLFEGTDEAAAIAALTAGANTLLHRVDHYGVQTEVTIELPLAEVSALAGIAGVQYIEEAPDVALRNSTTRWIIQSNNSGNFPVYDAGIHGENQIAGVMDGRPDAGHCSLDDGKIIFYNSPQGSDFHGTHVSGTVVGDNGVDNDTRGIAYEGTMVFDDVPSFTDTAMYNSLQQHHNQGARVHTNSWGDDGTTAYNGLTRGVDRFSYDNEDSLVLFAVTNLSTLRNPDNAKNLIAVGATQDTPSQASHCTGGVGPTSDGRRKPEVYAPGCGTQSASSGTSCSTSGLTGTSMACPAVAGASMLVRQYYVDGYYPSGAANAPDGFTPSGALIKSTVINSSVDMTGVTGYPSNLEGWGRARLGQALHFTGETRTLFVDDVRNASGLSTGEMVEYEVDLTDSSQKLKVTLVWTDPPAASGAGSAWINDLDLEVIAPDATLYRGNVFSGGESTSGGTADGINNVEQVHLSSPATGAWTVRVNAAAVNSGLQGYAVVITGAVTPDIPFSLSLPNGAPVLVGPGVATDVDVTVVPGNENITSTELFYSIDAGAYTSAPLTPVGGDDYVATLPALDCGQMIDYYVSVSGDGGTTRTEPLDAPTSVFSAEVGVESIPVDDAFEVDSGWTVGAPGDTATLGIWNRMDPEATDAQPEDDHTVAGTDCWVTDGNAGAALGTNDVDGGATTLLSPSFDVSGADTALISYWRWYSNDTGAGPNADTFRVDITDDGSTWVNVETVGPAGAGTSGGWIFHEFNVADFVSLGSNIQMRFIAEDAGAPSLVEAAVDDFQVRTRTCAQVECPTDIDGSGTVDLSDLAALLANFGITNANPEDGDTDGDGDVDLTDLAAVLADFGTNCP